MEDNRSIHALAYFNLLKTGSWVEAKIKDALKPFNLTHVQLNVLHTLMKHDPNPVSAYELKESILFSNPDVTRLLDRLVSKNFVLRHTCSENRRKIDISITDNGRKLYKEAHLAAKESVGNFFEKNITKEEASELRKILHKIMK